MIDFFSEIIVFRPFLCQKKSGPSGASNAIPALDITNLSRRSGHAR